MPRNSPQEMFIPPRQRVPKGCGLCNNPLPAREMWGVPWLTTHEPVTMSSLRRGHFRAERPEHPVTLPTETILWMMYLCPRCFGRQPTSLQARALWKPFAIWYASQPREPVTISDEEPWEARQERLAAERRYERAIIAQRRAERTKARRALAD